MLAVFDLIAHVDHRFIAVPLTFGEVGFTLSLGFSSRTRLLGCAGREHGQACNEHEHWE